MTSKPTSILAAFDEETQLFLQFMDRACTDAVGMIKDAEENDPDYKVTEEMLATMNLIRAYGVLYNRAVDAGWVVGLHKEKDPEIILP